MIRLHTLGKSNREIGRILNRSHTTIARELARNIHGNSDHDYYTYTEAHRKALSRRSRSRKKSQFTESQWRKVERLIRKDYSPEQVSNFLKQKDSLRICHETIYQFIYKDKRLGGTLHGHLRLRCRKKRKRYRSKDSRGVLAGKTMIQDRPPYINDRSIPGHWEIDTMMGTGSKDCIVTIVERQTRYLWIGKLQARTVCCLNEAVIAFIQSTDMPVLSITADNGTEFHGYRDIESSTGTKFYFATPHHAWERGTNENTNGLIRQYIPKGASMHPLTQEMCDAIAHRINTRPRKTLQYKTPSKAMAAVA